MSVHEKALDGLGYLNNNPDNLLGYLKTVGASRCEGKIDSDSAVSNR